VRFYRRTEGGWLHTAPRAAFWRDPVERTYGAVTVHCHERDQEQVEPLAQVVAQAYGEACEQIDCPAERRLEVRFEIEPALVDAPRLSPGEVQLASPWLSGVAADGKPDRAALEQIRDWGRWAAAAQSVGAPDLDPLQRALVAEYVAWAAGDQACAASLLGRVIERHGAQALPLVFRSLQAEQTLSAFLSEWLDLSANEDAVAYLVSLVQIEQEALCTGRRETYLLLQDPDTWWQAQQEAAFDRWQGEGSVLQCPETTVERVVLSGDGAGVAWRASALEQAGGAYRHIHYYRRQEGGWVHTWRPPDLSATIGSN
jgi:hypothetical protein